MRAIAFNPASDSTDHLAGAALCEEVRIGGKRRFTKGHILEPEEASELARSDRPLHLVIREPGDIHEDEAGRRLARAAAGQGVTVRGPVQSRVNLVAERKG